MSKKITSHPSLNYAADLKDICQPLEALGISYFSHVTVDNRGNFAALGLEPQFAQLYFEKKYYNFDIHMLDNTQPEKYIIWDGVEITHETKQLDDDYRALGLGHTFTILQTTKNNTNCFHFGTQLGRPEINQVYINNLDILKQFINYFFDKVHRHKELFSAYDIKFKIETEKAGCSIKPQKLDFKNDSLMNGSDRVYLSPNLYITTREWHCLYWLSQGKTLEEISLILSITLRTVKAHIGNIKDKFQCKNLFQLGTLFQQFQKNNSVDPI